MLNEVKNTLKSITIFNIIIAIVVLNTGFIFPGRYVAVILMGFVAGVINLYLRAIMVNKSAGEDSKGISLNLAVYLIRIILTAAGGAILFWLDKYYIFAYMGGYTLHFAGIILHGFRLLIVERKM